MKKILIIGAGVEQISAIKEAKKMGHFVIVTDMNPKAPGIKFADKFYEVSTTDAERNIEVAQKEQIDGVMTVCSETAVPTVAEVATRLNLQGFSPQTALFATNKEQMRKVVAQKGVRVAPFVVAGNLNDTNAYFNEVEPPWVIKPVDNSGQRGTSIIYDKKYIEQAFAYAKENSYSKKVLVDKFIEGPEIHITMQIINKKAHFLAISDRITLDKNNFGIAVRHIGPSVLDAKTEYEVKQMCQNSIDAINLENGVATCEIILNNGIPYLMELAIRVPGGYLREVAQLLSGIDITKTTIWNCLGENRTIEQMITGEKNNAVSVKFISANNVPKNVKVISKIEGDNISDYQDIKLINFHFDNDFEIPPLKSSVGRFAVIIGVGNSREEALLNTEKVFRNLKFNGEHLIEYKNYNKFCVDFQKFLI
jgi:biotin carboxylase